MPKDVWKAKMLAEEIRGFLDQSNISQKNIKRLGVLQAHVSPVVRSLAITVEQIASIAPRRKRRWKVLRTHNWEVYARCIELRIVHADVEFDEDDETFDPCDIDDGIEDIELGVWITPRAYEFEPDDFERHDVYWTNEPGHP